MSHDKPQELTSSSSLSKAPQTTSHSKSVASVPQTVKVVLESQSPKLAGVAVLLRYCIQKAQTVVRGTESQRLFNLQFSELCRTLSLCAYDIELEVNERRKQEIPAAAAAQRDVFTHVSEGSLLGDVAAYVSVQCGNKLTQGYLDHLGKSSLAQNDAQQRAVQERIDASSVASRAAKKRGRAAEKPPAVAAPHQRAGALAAMSPRMQSAASPQLSAKSPGGLRPAMSPLHLGDAAHGLPNRSTAQDAKLTTTPAFQPLLMPWTMPLPYAHGIALDRVTVERHQSTPVVAPSSLPASSSRVKEMPRILDICTATNPSVMLALWEERTAQLDQLAPASCPAQTMLGSSASMSSIPLLSKQASTLESPMVKPISAAPLAFFPSMGSNKQEYVDSVPRLFLVQLVHFGVSSVEAAHKSR